MTVKESKNELKKTKINFKWDGKAEDDWTTWNEWNIWNIKK